MKKIDSAFLSNFLAVSADVERQGRSLSWPIPNNADKNRGDLGLLPEDTCIEAWQVPRSSAMLLLTLVLLTQSRTILELGSSIGFSTLWLGLGAMETGGQVYATEIFPEKAALAKENFHSAGLDSCIALFEEDILSVLKCWDSKKMIDFVFMDADKQRYCQYFDQLYPLLKDGALIVVDNAGNYAEYMTDFLDRCQQLQNDVVHFLKIDNGLLLIIKNGGVNLCSQIKI